MKAVVYHGPGSKAWERFPDTPLQDHTHSLVLIGPPTSCGLHRHRLRHHLAQRPTRPSAATNARAQVRKAATELSGPLPRRRAAAKQRPTPATLPFGRGAGQSSQWPTTPGNGRRSVTWKGSGAALRLQEWDGWRRPGWPGR